MSEEEFLGPRVRVASFPDGSQVLIEDWLDHPSTAAVRGDSREVWGPPVTLREV